MEAFLSKVILKVHIVASLTASLAAEDQNYITPLKDKTNFTTSGVTGCPRLFGLLPSSCKIPCENTDDCINHGNLICCRTVPGSSCDAECVVPTVLTNSDHNTDCIDYSTNKTYKAGETFVTTSGAGCCTCLRNGTLNCTSSMHMCEKGCLKDKVYFGHGEIVEESPCESCTCENQSIVCRPVKGCLKGHCKYKGGEYDEGYELQLDHQQGCRLCICTKHRWKCEVLACNAVISGSRDLTALHGRFVSYLLGSLFFVRISLRRITAIG